MAKGKWEEADRICTEWKPENPADISYWKPYLSGVIKTELKQWEESEKTIGKFSDSLENNPGVFYWTQLRRGILDLSGRKALAEENYTEAIAYLRQMKEFLDDFHHDDHAWYIEPLARAYHRAEELEKAKQEYERITSLSQGRKNHGDIYAKAFYMLGNIAEEMGKKGEARRQYARFLELWKNADPEIPELEDAKRRLSQL